MKTKTDKLAYEAMELIKEFAKESDLFGFNILDSISYNKENEMLKVKLTDEEEEEYYLFEISKVFFHTIEYGILDESIDLELDEVSNIFKNLDREQFINRIGRLYYAKYRCKEIYNRLKEIEKEA